MLSISLPIRSSEHQEKCTQFFSSLFKNFTRTNSFPAQKKHLICLIITVHNLCIGPRRQIYTGVLWLSLPKSICRIRCVFRSCLRWKRDLPVQCSPYRRHLVLEEPDGVHAKEAADYLQRGVDYQVLTSYIKNFLFSCFF